jgi:UDP-N-acetylmuramate dehydrogenase
LADYVAFRVGGPAEYLLEPHDEEEIRKAVDAALQAGIPITIVGAGTNLLVRDKGVRGLVIYLGAGLPGELQVLNETPNEVWVRAPSHWPKASLLDYAVEQTWAGLEFSAGIPGTLGGAVFMNAGTKWGSYGEVIERVRLYKPGLGFVEKTREEMGFKYRGHGEGLLEPGTVVISADLKLSKTKAVHEIRALIDEILAYRGGKQPLELPNCGSVFKNPPGSALGAGRLIEACQLKGLRVGDAMISKKHANFILNLGQAKAADIEALIRHVQATVLKEKQIALETEVIVLGES